MAHGHGFRNRPDVAHRGLQGCPNIAEGFNIRHSGAVQAWWFRCIEFQIAVVDAQAREGSKDMFNEADVERWVADGGATVSVGYVIGCDQHWDGRPHVSAKEYQSRVGPGGPKANANTLTGEEPPAEKSHRGRDCALRAMAEPSHDVT